MQPPQYSKEQGLLGRLCVGEKKLEGKTFYLDNVKKRSTILLLEAISLLGGRIESFLHKDVNFVVTGSQDVLKEETCLVVTKGDAKGTSEGTQEPKRKQESDPRNDKQRPGTPRPMVCGSRGKALLEKAISNKERLQRSSTLSNARSWGVKILHADDVLFYLKQLTRECFGTKHKKAEKTATKQSFSSVKAAALRSPFLKVEDISRKYKPLHMQSMTFPVLCYSGRFSPFESPPPPPRFDKQTGQSSSEKREKKVENSLQDKSQIPLTYNPSPWRPRKKDSSYCECCHQTFTNLEEHLQSDEHRSFVLDPSNYTVVDQLVVEMLPGFDPDPFQQTEERPPTPLSIHVDYELEPLTDVEMEHTVQVLLKDEPSFHTRISSPTRSLHSSSPTGPSAEVNFAILNPVTPPFDPHSFNVETHHEPSDVQPLALSPAMPERTVEPLDQQPETVPPCLSALCPLVDPYSLPPVLSPQIPYSISIMDPQSPYPDPPILTPQKCTREEILEGSMFETNPADYGSTVPLLTLLQTFVTDLEEERESNPLEGTSQSSLSSYSLPLPSVVASSPKKRFRSASPEHRNSKRRRTAISGESINTLEPPYIKMLSSTSPCFASCSTFPHSAVETFTLSPTPMNSAPRLDGDKEQYAISSHDPLCSHSASVRIEPALIPDLATISSTSSDSDWDCDLLSRLGPTSAKPLTPGEQQNRKLDKELLHMSCPWMHDNGYDSHLHNVLQASTPAASLCAEDAEPQPFSRTMVQIVEVLH